MERLTIRNSDGSVSQPTDTTVEAVFYHLAAYEDTGLTPEQVMDFKQKWDMYGGEEGIMVLLEKANSTPPNDPLTAEDTTGLKQKYIVVKAKDGEPVDNCFVLRPEKDPAAVIAIRAYAGATHNATLKSDLIAWVGTSPNDPLTLEELREMDWEPAWVEGAELGRNGRKGYAILWYSKIEKYLCVWWPCEEYADIPRLELYGKTWRVFRRKPEEGTDVSNLDTSTGEG